MLIGIGIPQVSMLTPWHLYSVHSHPTLYVTAKRCHRGSLLYCIIMQCVASHTNQLIKEKADPTFIQSAPNRRTGNFTRNPLDTLAGRVTAKLEEGDFKGAFCLASSEGSIEVPSSETLAALREKHPLPHSN